MRDILNGVLFTGLLAVAGVVVPVFGTLGALLLPVPIMGYRLKSGRRPAAAIAATVLSIVGIIGGGADMLFFGLLMLTGFLLGEAAAVALTLERAVALTAAGAFAAGWLGLVALAASVGVDTGRLIDHAVAASLELTLAVYREIGVDPEQVRFLADSMATIQRVVAGLTPGLALAGLLFVIWVCLLAVRPFLKRLGATPPDYGRLDRWRAPEPLVWAVIGAGALLLIPDFTAKIAGLNGLIALAVVYFFQGIAIVAFFLERKRVPPVARGVAYALIFFQQLVLAAVIAAGFFDTWFNFRKLQTPLPSSQPE